MTPAVYAQAYLLHDEHEVSINLQCNTGEESALRSHDKCVKVMCAFS